MQSLKCLEGKRIATVLVNLTRRWLASGRLRSVRVGAITLVRVADVEEFLVGATAPAEGEYRG